MTAGAPPLLGRDAELDLLRAALADVRAGRRQVLLLAGEGGIGKTRLAAELADEARALGVFPVWGRCWEAGGAPVLWPWQQVLSQLLQTFGADVHLTDDVRAGLQALVPSAGRDLGAAAPSSEGRFRFFAAATELIRTCAQVRPLLLMVDDLHGADEATLLLLEYAAAELVGSPVLLLGGFRQEEARRHSAVHEALGRVAAHGALVELAGLGERDVAELVRDQGGADDPESVRRLVDATAGNPFFLGELLARRDGEVLPHAVRAAVRRRIDPLPDDVRDLLAAVAVLGRAVDARTLADILGWPPEDVLDRLDQAHREGVLVLGLDAQGGSAFRHALLQETVYADLSSLQRCELHLRAGRTLAGAVELGAERSAEIAYHLVRALPLGDVERAAAACVVAAERALASFGFQEAADLYAQAVRLEPSPDPRRHGELLLAHGRALLAASRFDDARSVLLRAVDLARLHAMPEVLARAALGYGGLWFQSEVDDTFRALLEEALGAVGHSDSTLRAQLLARTSQALFFDVEAQLQMQSMTAEALEIARESGDAETLTYALTAARMSRTGPEFHLARPGLTAELIPLADATGNHHLALRARHWRIVESLEAGKIDAADRFIGESTRLAETLGHPLLLGWNRRSRAGRALLSGRYDEADRLMHEALELAQRGGDPRVLDQYGVQLSTLRRDQGRAGELLPALDSLVESSPYAAGWRAARALAQVEVGDLDAARVDLDVVADAGFDAVPRDSWLITIVLLSETAAAVGDEARCRELYQLLLPYADLAIVVGLADACYGAACRMLGRLASTFGDAEVAETHLVNAVAMNRDMGAAPYLARAQVDLAEHILSLGSVVARPEAIALLDDAEAVVAEIGMAGLTRRLAEVRLRADLGADTAAATALVESAEEVALRPAVGGSVIDLASSRAARRASSPTSPADSAPPSSGPTSGSRPAVLTLVVVDVDGADIHEAIGDSAWAELRSTLHSVVRQHLASYDGRELGLHGSDGLTVGFAGARAALHFTRRVLREVNRLDRVHRRAVPVRIGVHSGEVTVTADGVVGRHVRLAAGVCAAADPGQVLVSAVTREIVQGDPALGFADPRTVSLDGVAEPQVVYSLD